MEIKYLGVFLYIISLFLLIYIIYNVWRTKNFTISDSMAALGIVVTIFLALDNANTMEDERKPKKINKDIVTNFRDDFKGKKLHQNWKIIAPDDTRLAFENNEYFMIVTHEKEKNIIQLDSDVPDNYEVTLKIQTPPQHDNQISRLSLLRDNENQLNIGYYAKYFNGYKYKGAEVYFEKILDGEISSISKSITSLSKNEQLYIKITKHGIKYSGSYSKNGSIWSNLGEHIFKELKGKPTFQTYNIPINTFMTFGNFKNPPESGILFDYFEIKRLE